MSTALKAGGPIGPPVPESIRRSSETSYFSPSQVSIYVGNTWIDDAAGLQYEIRDEKVPVYGYADTHVRAFLRGRTLITGVLYINFRFKNYLSLAIDRGSSAQAGFKKYRESQDSTFQEFFDADSLSLTPSSIPTIGGILANDLARRFIPTGINGIRQDFRAIKAALTGKFWARPATPSPSPGRRSAPGALQLYEGSGTRAGALPTTGLTDAHGEVNLILVYGDEENIERPAYYRTVRDVQLTGESQEISGIGGAGDNVILEAYPFLARELV